MTGQTRIGIGGENSKMKSIEALTDLNGRRL
jgi:hypothetical protein